MRFLVTILFVCLAQTPLAHESCKLDSCYDPYELKSWIQINSLEHIPMRCEEHIMTSLNEDVSIPFYKEVDCDDHSWMSYAITSGKTDENGRPKGNVVFNYRGSKQNPTSLNHCYALLQNMRTLKGNFVNGFPQGQVLLINQDKRKIQGHSENGVLHGKVRMFNSDGTLSFVGHFRNGRPFGPCWIVPPDFKRSGVVQMEFDEDGEIIIDKVIYVNPDWKSGVVGRLDDGIYLLNARKFIIESIEERNCVLTITNVPSSPLNEMKSEPLKLPVICERVDYGIGLDIKTSKTFVFNRIPKTGSQSIIALLYELKSKTQIDPMVIIKSVDTMMEPPSYVQQFIETVLSTLSPSITIRHYNFVDFKKYGPARTPIYINIVRHPIDRVISWFYYKRASWNIVERLREFPDYELPDSAFLRKDFDSCVLDPEDDECNFIPGTSNLDFVDHRSQMMAFCGHDLFCSEFNSERVLQKAKENVERYYPVVGILEELNSTLAVFESVLPDLFPAGTTELYHSNPEVKHKQNRNLYKTTPNERVLEILRANMTREIEFYEFCRSRLRSQLERIQQNKE